MAKGQDKVDLKQELKPLYRPSTRAVSEVDVPPISFIMVDGQWCCREASC